MATSRFPFEKLTPIHPNRHMTLETGPTPIAPRLIDLFVRVGFGQRAVVVSPPKAGKTTILRQIATAVKAGLLLRLVLSKSFLCWEN
jgi:transcription termination factor Rho